jgi:hypothetical protein
MVFVLLIVLQDVLLKKDHVFLVMDAKPVLEPQKYVLHVEEVN